jgi:hypothetical protein
LDGANIGAQQTEAPFALPWDFTGVATGPHTLTAQACDAAGNSAVSAATTVNVVPPITVTLSPASLNFGAQLLQFPSTSQVVTVMNTGGLTAVISGVQITGDFSETNTCSSLPAGATCAINVVFTPSVRGAESATLTVSGNFTSPAPSVTLSGTGQAMLGTLTPSSLSFGGQIIGTIGSAQYLTYTNTGDVPVTISSISTSGDFSQTNTCPASLSVGANCAITVTFKPPVRGAETGVLSVAGSVAASAQLSGSGLALLASVTPSSLNFGNQIVNTVSSPLTVTITNVGDASFYINSWGIGGPFSQTGTNCPFTLAVSNSCTATVTFTPTSIGSYSGYFSVGGNFSESPASVTLSGTGVSAASMSPAALNFGNQFVNTASPTQAVTLSNAGTTSVIINSILTRFSNGQAATMFNQTNNCGGTLAGGANCTINVAFQPSSLGAVTAGLYVYLSNGTLSTGLSGNGIGPQAVFTPTTLTFGSQRVGTSSAAQNVVLSNSGTAPLAISTITIGGEFGQTNNCGTTLAVGGSCNIAVTFSPVTRGNLTGWISLNSNTAGSSPVTNLSGIGIGPVATTSVSSLTFGSQNVGTTSSAQAVTLTNTGDATLNISSIQIAGDFAQSGNCSSTLSAGANCTLNVTFTPTGTGTRTGFIVFSDDSVNGSTQQVTLSGTGSTPAASLSPSSLTFAAQRVHTSSAPQIVTLSNPGNATLSISNIAITGDFSQSNNCGATLIAGGSCSINVTFTPSALGNRAGTLTVNSNAPGGAVVTSLAGTGVGSIASVSPPSLSFAATMVKMTSSAQAVTISNTGAAALNLSSITTSGDFAQTNNCGASVAPGGQCTVSVTFTPTVGGTRSGALTISDDSLSGSPQTVTLSGSGLDFSISATPSSITVSAGNTANYTTTAKAVGGTFNSAIGFSCSGLPTAATCAFTPASVTPGSGSASTKITITTTKRHSGSGTPAGTYTITVIAASGSLQHSITITLIVN